MIAEAATLCDAAGPEGMTLVTLAGRLGVRAPSLYKHIGGLDDLRAGVATLGLDELGATLRSAVAGRAGRDALGAFGHAYVDYARAHPGRYTLSLRAPEPTGAAKRLIELFHATLRSLALEGDEAVHAVRAIRAALHGFCGLEAAGGFGVPVALDASLDRLLDMLTAGLRDDR